MCPALTLEVQLICNGCGQPYYPDKSWEDRIRAIVFGPRNMPCVRYAPKQCRIMFSAMRATGFAVAARLCDCNACSNLRVRHTGNVNRMGEIFLSHNEYANY